MEILIGVAVGVVAWNVLVYGYHTVKQWRQPKRLVVPTNYDIRIDELTSSGLMRYKIHKAMTSPARRVALKEQPFYEQACVSLDWNA